MIDKNLKLILFVALFVGGVTPQAWAQTSSPTKPAAEKQKTFDVSETVLHADAPRAEICLTLTQPIDIRDRARVASFLELKKDGKKQKINPIDLSLTSQDVCLQNLEHRHTYDLALQRIESVHGQRLAKKYSVTYTVPDRKAVLTFVGDNRRLMLPRHVREIDEKKPDSDLMRVGMAHVVRSVNVMATHLTLYRITDRKLFAEAWQQFKQMNLSPSESLTFGREKGQIVFESDLVFGDAPNEDQTLVAPLPVGKELPAGLYFLAATPRGKEGSNPGLSAGQWFLVSDLRLVATRIRDGIKIFASQGSGSLQAAAGVAVAALDKDGKELAEASTAADGAAFLTLSPADLDKVVVVTGQMPSGDVDLFEIGADRTITTKDILVNAKITTDRSVYRSGMSAILGLRVENGKGEAQDVGESLVQLKTAEQKVYSQQTLPAGKAGYHTVTLSLPNLGVTRTWTVAWLKKDGGLLAETQITISPQGSTANLSLGLDRTSVDMQVPMTVTVKAVDSDKKPVAFKNGSLSVRTSRPEIPGWLEYRFGDVTAQSGREIQKIDFITGADGLAHVPVAFSPEEKAAGFGVEGVSFTAELENEGHSASVSLPVRVRGDLLLGVKPHFDGRAFPENSVAQLDVVAVDMSGKRRQLSDLYYLVYEEGRSFEWVPMEGHWDYRQRPDHRRIGGGSLNIAATGDNTIRWPVTAGHYVLEITNAAGEVLSRYDFDAGRRDRHVVRQDEGKLHFVQPMQRLEAKGPNQVKLQLSEPAMVSVLVTDGVMRQTYHRFMKAGVNDVEITPTEEWGRQVLVRAEALFARSFDPVVAQHNMTIHAAANDLTVKLGSSSPIMAGRTVSLPVLVQKQNRQSPSFVSVVASPQSSDGILLSPVSLGRVPVTAEGKADVRLTLPEFEGTVKLSIVAWNDTQKGELLATLPVQPAFGIDGDVPEYLRIGDKVNVRVSLANHAAQAASVTYLVKGPSGLVFSGATSGKLAVKKGQKQQLPLTFTARGPVEGDLVLEVQIGATQTVTKTWPVYAPVEQIEAREESIQTIDAEQAFSASALKQVKDGVVLVAPLPMKNVLQGLQHILYSEPQTTIEIAQWIDVTQSWSTVIHQSGLMGEKRWVATRDRHKQTLLRRQNEDGGFAVLKAGDPSDLLSSAMALKALAGHNEEAIAFGLPWVAERLQNTWFDESERTTRALAFEVLASFRKADISGLRYFAETSSAKNPSVVAMAAIAHALVLVEDETLAQSWLARTRSVMQKEVTSQPPHSALWQAITLLGSNDKTSFEDLEKLMPKAESAALSYQGAAHMLKAIQQVSRRAGTWRTLQNNEEGKHFVVWVLPQPLKPEDKGDAFRNIAARKLFVTQSVIAPQAKTEKTKALPVTVVRQLYTPDGQMIEEGATLHRGKSYILSVQASYAKAVPSRMNISSPAVSAYKLSVPLGGQAKALKALYNWAPEDLTDLSVVASGTAPVGFLVDAGKEWKTLLFVRPVAGGSYLIPPLEVRSDETLLAGPQNAPRFWVE